MTTTKTLSSSLAGSRQVKWLLETRKKTRGEELELTIGRTRLSLTVVAVVVTREQGLVNVDRVGDGLAETVTLENHGDKLCRLVRDAGEKWTRV
jgi:hypothetical protein